MHHVWICSFVFGFCTFLFRQCCKTPFPIRKNCNIPLFVKISRQVCNIVSLIQHQVIPNSCVTASASASMVTPSADTSVSNGVYVPGGITNGDVKPAVSTTPLADFLMQLEEYTPTVSRGLPVSSLYAAFRDTLSELPQVQHCIICNIICRLSTAEFWLMLETLCKFVFPASHVNWSLSPS